MQPYLLSPMERLRHWKEFRSSLNETQTDEEQLLLVTNYWQQFPVSSRNLDPYAPETWLTAWELAHRNDYCLSSLAYMMEQTLLLCDDNRWNSDRIQLAYINDEYLGQEFIILIVDNKYIINYSQNEIIDFNSVKNNFTIYHIYSIEKEKHKII